MNEIRLLSLGPLGLLASMASAVNIATVPVGDPGNTADTHGAGYGSVTYTYNIGKYEVTAGQYTEFLNKVAATDTYGLYNTGMSYTEFGSGITQSGLSGSYSYTVATDFFNRPVNYVSYWDACRFTNWLHNGQPTGAQGAGTTETGAYTLDGYNGYGGETIQRNVNAKWAVTSENEWYKAAYYKGGSTTEGYYAYPTSSDTAPGRDMADASGNNANIYGSPYPIDSGKNTTVGGKFQNSGSPYGTFDQGGNVFEWDEAVVNGSSRGLRGGSFGSADGDLHATYRYDGYAPTGENCHIGFRVVEVPEPCSALMMLVGVFGLASIRRRG